MQSVYLLAAAKEMDCERMRMEGERPVRRPGEDQDSGQWCFYVPLNNPRRWEILLLPFYKRKVEKLAQGSRAKIPTGVHLTSKPVPLSWTTHHARIGYPDPPKQGCCLLHLLSECQEGKMLPETRGQGKQAEEPRR